MATDADIRPGETTVALAPPADAALRFIGTIRTPFKTRDDCPRQGSEDGPLCRIELDPVWQEALEGTERLDRIEVYYWLDQSRRDLLRQSPKRDGSTVGTFAVRSPVRPNPIGVSVVRIEARRGNVLEVRGLDCVDGTPLLDLKPQRCPHAAPRPDTFHD